MTIIGIAIVVLAAIYCLLVPVSRSRQPRSRGHEDGQELFEWASKEQ